MKTGLDLRSALLLAACLLGGQSPAYAQQYPTQPVRVILPYSTGTGIDTVTRIAAERLRARLGQPVIVENRVGASGNIGTDAVAKAAPDGYTLLLVANTLAINPSLYRLPFDTLNDLEPIGVFAKGGMVLAVGPSTDGKTLPELVAAAKKDPGRLNYASPGIGTPHHLAMELFKKTLGINIVHVPHKGAADAMTSLLGGRVEAMFAPVQTVLPHVKSKRLRALAVASPTRHAALPDVPTVAEVFNLSGFDVDLWYALFVPASTPAAVVERLNRELLGLLSEADMKATLAAQGMVPAPSSPGELGQLLKSDIKLWASVIKEAGIKAE